MITHGSAYAILIKLGGIRFAHAELSLTDKMQIKFLNGQVVYWKRGTEGCNAKLVPHRVRRVILQRKGKALYELGSAQGKSVGVFHAKDYYVA